MRCVGGGRESGNRQESQRMASWTLNQARWTGLDLKSAESEGKQKNKSLEVQMRVQNVFFISFTIICSNWPFY